MTFIVELDNFNGPFDVLLDLLGKQQLEITELALGEITGDYLEYIEHLELGLEEMTWFLFVAAKLVLDKSSAILCLVPSEDEVNLETSLKGYEQLKNMALTLAQLLKYPSFSRVLTEDVKIIVAPIASGVIRSNYEAILAQSRTLLETKVIKSKSRQVEQIRSQFINHIRTLKSFSMGELLGHSKSRSETIIYFLAILDLIRDGNISSSGQSFIFSEVVV